MGKGKFADPYSGGQGSSALEGYGGTSKDPFNIEEEERLPKESRKRVPMSWGPGRERNTRAKNRGERCRDSKADENLLYERSFSKNLGENC